MDSLRHDLYSLSLEEASDWESLADAPHIAINHEARPEAQGCTEGFASPSNTCSVKEQDQDSAGDANELTCAICLGQIPPAEMAVVKGCEHMYCAFCILQWASCKESPLCPQCKLPFEFLQLHRQLDGTPTDYPVEESVTLLKRTKWYEEQCKAHEKGNVREAPKSSMTGTDGDWYGDFYEDFTADDDDIEDYYFSSAAGAARAVLGNRRLGENGYMRSGRMYARPVSVVNAPKTKGKGKAPAAPGSSPSALGSSPGAPSPGTSSGSKSAGNSGNGSGRRARRSAKRAVVDDYDD